MLPEARSIPQFPLTKHQYNYASAVRSVLILYPALCHSLGHSSILLGAEWPGCVSAHPPRAEAAAWHQPLGRMVVGLLLPQQTAVLLRAWGLCVQVGSGGGSCFLAELKAMQNSEVSLASWPAMRELIIEGREICTQRSTKSIKLLIQNT